MESDTIYLQHLGLYLEHTAVAAAAKLLQSCLTLCDPTDGSPPGSSVPGILQARTLEWVAISFSNAWKWKVKMKSLTLVGWTAAYQAPLSMGFSRQEYVLVSGIQQSDCYMYTHYFSYSFPIQVFTKYWVEFPVLYSRSLLVIYFTYSNVCIWWQFC